MLQVAAAEAGGITQGIGAYKVQVPIDGNTQTCVFLDTPGHEVKPCLVLIHTFGGFSAYLLHTLSMVCL